MTDLPVTHLSIETLRSLGESGHEPGQAAARAHLNGCEQCQGELARLDQRIARLKALPVLRPARDHWPAIAARRRQEIRARRVRSGGLAGLAAAASVAAALALGGGLRPASPGPAAAEITQAVERSQALESALDEYDPEGRIVDGRTAGIAQELENQIARVDRELEMTELVERRTRDAELLRLWNERVGLLDALVDVHVTRASHVGL